MSKITAYDPATSFTSDDVLIGVDSPGSSPVTKKYTQAIIQRDTQGGIEYTWPASNGDANQVLMTDGEGVLSWAALTEAIALTGLSDVTITTQAIGDVVYASSGSAWVNLAGNTTATKKFLTQTGNGSASAAPAWGTLIAGDIPDLSATYQPLDADLTAIGALAKTDGNFIVGNGTAWVAESGATARTSLGVDAAGTDNSTNVTLAGTLDYITISGQEITRGAIDLATDITLASLAQFDILYGASSTGLSRLAGHIAASNKFLRMIGTGAAAQAPSWEALGTGDIPDLSATYSAVGHTHTLDGLSDVTVTTQALGDVVYASSGSAWVNLAGNTTTTKKFLRQTGNGSVSAAPAWDTVTASDVGLGSVENTALSTWAGSTAITTLGTIATGTLPYANLSGAPTSWAASAITAGTFAAGAFQFQNGLGVDGDFDVATSKFTVASATGNTVVAGTLRVSGSVYINDSANTKSTIGLTINNGTNNDDVISLKASAVAHSFSTAESDTYGVIRHGNITNGGIQIRGFSVGDSIAVLLVGYQDTASSSTTPSFRLNGRRSNGAGGTAAKGDASPLVAINNDGTDKSVFLGGGSLLIGGTIAATTGTSYLGIFTGTAPTAVAADSIALYSSDLSAGNTIPSIWTEGTGIYAAGTPAASTGSIAMRVNGTVYYFTVSTTAAA